jgi:arylsulfatase A-like enzyme
MSKSNILLVILDTTRRDHLSAYGFPKPTTPHLDAFAADSALFTRAVAPAQWTIPAHASIFTGLYPSAHGVTQSVSAVDAMQPTLAEILRTDGYRTAAFCNNPLVGVLFNGLQRGFDEFYNYASAIPQRPPGAQTPLRRAFIRRVQPYARRFANIFARHDTLFRLALSPRWTPIWSKAINFKGSTPDSVGDLIQWIAARRRDDPPYFAFLNLMGAHLPYHPPSDALEAVAPELKNDKRAYAFIRQFNADAAGWASPPLEPYTDWQQHALHAFYDAELHYQDRDLGRLFSALKASGTLDNTVIIVAADHGESHGDHDLFGHGFKVHQELVHVPLIIRDPERFKPGSQIAANVSTRRLFHTILERAGVLPPLDESDPNADIHRLTLANPDGERVAFSEAFPPSIFLNVLKHRTPDSVVKLQLGAVRRGVYAGDIKLTVRDAEGGVQVERLYNVAADPFEDQPLPLSDPAVEPLRTEIERFAAASTPQNGERADASPEVLERLRALGYIE